MQFEFAASGNTYPSEYDGALFFADYSRDCIWVMYKGADGRPAPGLVRTFVAAAANPVNLETGPGGDLFYVDFDGGTVRRIAYTATVNQPPTAVAITVGNTPPTANITSPAAGTTWKVGDVINFSGSATDQQDGTLPASALSWDLTLYHCPSNCHTHPVQSFTGMSSGSFVAPDHEYPSYLELRLTATDSGSLTSTKTLRLDPRTVVLSFQTNPGGLKLVVNGASSTATFTRTVIVGSNNTISATTPQTKGNKSYNFQSWSDGGRRPITSSPRAPRPPGRPGTGGPRA